MTRYGTILADPPWLERGGGKIKRGADRHYPLMYTKDICALPVQGIAAPDSHLYLWVTNNFLPDGLQVMEAWGFRYVTTITWAKDRFGLGQYFRGQTEHCLFGVRGKPGYKVANGKRCQGTTLISAPRGEHSAKPEALRHMIERVSPGPYLELFVCKEIPG
jgi:N6-adenosine-specific RNA methylase IME4